MSLLKRVTEIILRCSFAWLLFMFCWACHVVVVVVLFKDANEDILRLSTLIVPLWLLDDASLFCLFSCFFSVSLSIFSLSESYPSCSDPLASAMELRAGSVGSMTVVEAFDNFLSRSNRLSIVPIILIWSCEPPKFSIVSCDSSLNELRRDRRPGKIEGKQYVNH